MAANTMRQTSPSTITDSQAAALTVHQTICLVMLEGGGIKKYVCFAGAQTDREPITMLAMLHLCEGTCFLSLWHPKMLVDNFIIAFAANIDLRMRLTTHMTFNSIHGFNSIAS